jgi:hypothetical protein
MMKKIITLSASIFCIAIGLNAQQQKATNVPKVVKATKVETPTEIQVQDDKPAAATKVSAPLKLEKSKPVTAKQPIKPSPDARLRVKRAKPESAKPAVKNSESK